MELTKPDDRLQALLNARERLSEANRRDFEIPRIARPEIHYDINNEVQMAEFYQANTSTPSEDFAECFAWYWLAPEQFERERPKRAAWFRHNFPTKGKQRNATAIY